MLRDIYLSAGGVGTFFIAVGMFVTFIGWWMAITEAVTRETLSTGIRAVLILFVSLLPPLGIVVATAFIRADAREVSQAMKSAPDSEKRAERLMRLPNRSHSVKAA